MRRNAAARVAADELEPEPAAEVQPLRTEFGFLLPRGYVSPDGTVHRDGVMRLATARDELVSQRDDRVRENPSYLTVVLVSRVLVRLGGIEDVHAGVVENMFASDLAFLQDLYRRVNQDGHTQAGVQCPNCQHEFAVDVSGAATTPHRSAQPGSRLGES